MIPSFMLPPSFQKAIARQEADRRKAERKYYREVLVPNAVDWDLWMPWSTLKQYNDNICIKASTYKTEPIFDLTVAPPKKFSVKIIGGIQDDDLVHEAEEYRQGKVIKRTWVYRNLVLPKGESLRIFLGNREGTVYFDGDVMVPVLYEKTWKLGVWMGVTPMEQITQRAGIRHCSGDVCIGGLGLGWFLEQVAQKRSVKSITVVESSSGLLDWFGRRRVKEIRKKTGKSICVVHGDVFEHLKKHHEKYDKIALDVFKYYGGNNPNKCHNVGDLLYTSRWHETERFPKKKLWCWGAANVSDKRGTW